MKRQAQALLQAVMVFKLEGVAQSSAIKNRRSGTRPGNIARLPNAQQKSKQHVA